jgi:transposase
MRKNLYAQARPRHHALSTTTFNHKESLMTTRVSLGLDMAKRTFDAALLQEGRTRHRQFANTPVGFQQLEAWLRQQATAPIHAGLEATSCYGEALALFLHQHHVPVSVINPARTHAFAKSELARTKTDKADAALIARFVATQQPPLWTPPPPEQRQLQGLVRRLEALQAMRQQERNRLDLEEATSLLREFITTHLTQLEDQIRQVQQRLRVHLRAHPVLQQRGALLQSIPGIGECTALKLLAELPSPLQCRNARQAAAYAGLCPRHRESGSSVRGKTHLSKTGNARLRKALYLPAVVAMRYNPILREFAQRLLERGKPKMAVVGAVMRKLLHQAFGVLKHGQPFNPNYALTR